MESSLEAGQPGLLVNLMLIVAVLLGVTLVLRILPKLLAGVPMIGAEGLHELLYGPKQKGRKRGLFGKKKQDPDPEPNPDAEAIQIAESTGTSANPDAPAEDAAPQRYELILLDVRTEKEFRGGHIPGSVNITGEDIKDGLDGASDDPEKAETFMELKDHPIAIICASGSRSAQAARKLKKAGFAKLMVLDGGIAAWQRQKFPISMG